MKTRSLLPTVLISALLLGLNGCARGPISMRFGGDDPENQTDHVLGDQKAEDLISWDEVSQKVFLNPNAGRCNACHEDDEAPNLTNYQEFKAEIRGVYDQVVEKRKMPRRRTLTDEQIALVKTWIEQGAPEKGP